MSEPADRLMMVTGGGAGLGRAIARQALADGYRVAVGDRNAAVLDALLGDGDRGRLHTHVVDITRHDAVDAWVTDVVAELGSPDALINNAGIGRWTALEDVAPEDWQAVVDVNLTGAFLVTQRVGREMVAAGRGCIVGISSVAGLEPSAGAGAYSPTKAALSMLMRLAAVEWGRHGVRVNSVCPGFIRAGLAANFYDDPRVEEDRRSRVPLGRIGTEQDVVDAVLFLCSDKARYITGIDLVVDGGWSQTVSSSAARFAEEIR